MLHQKTDFVRWGLLVLIANLVLTTLLVALKPVLNYDGVLYLSAAQAISEANTQYASELYKGLFYPHLINLTHILTPLSLENSAHFLNSLLLTVMSLGFIAIVYQLGGRSKRIILISTLVILFFPSLLKYRPFIIRDFGFLACYLWSLFFLLKYQQDKSIIAFFAWALILVFASFIRIESAAYLSIIAICLLPWNKLVLNIKCLIITITAATGAVFVILFSGAAIEQLSSIHPSLAYPFQYTELALTKLNRSFAAHNENNVFVALIESVGQIIYESIRRLEFVYAVMAFIAVKKGWVLQGSKQRASFIYYIAASIIILTLFSLGARYFSSRYTMALALTVLTLAPFTLEKAFQHFASRTKTQQAGLIFLALILCALSAKRFKPNDHHLELTTGKWALNNLAHNVLLASNNSKILYYFEQDFRYLPRKNRHYRFDNRYLLSEENKAQLSQSDYLAFELKTKDEDAVKQEQLFNAQYGSPIKVIKQSDGHYVNIYDLR